jgi:hypothetical protein
MYQLLVTGSLKNVAMNSVFVDCIHAKRPRLTHIYIHLSCGLFFNLKKITILLFIHHKVVVDRAFNQVEMCLLGLGVSAAST